MNLFIKNIKMPILVIILSGIITIGIMPFCFDAKKIDEEYNHAFMNNQQQITRILRYKKHKLKDLVNKYPRLLPYFAHYEIAEKLNTTADKHIDDLLRKLINGQSIDNGELDAIIMESKEFHDKALALIDTEDRAKYDTLLAFRKEKIAKYIALPQIKQQVLGIKWQNSQITLQICDYCIEKSNGLLDTHCGSPYLLTIQPTFGHCKAGEPLTGKMRLTGYYAHYDSLRLFMKNKPYKIRDNCAIYTEKIKSVGINSLAVRAEYLDEYTNAKRILRDTFYYRVVP